MKLIKTKNILVFVFLAVLVFSVLIFVGDYKEIGRQLSKIKIITLIILLLFSFGNYLVRFVKWQFFLNLLQIRVKLHDSFLIFLSGLSMAFTPIKIGETVKSYLLYKMEKVNVRISLPIIFSERLTDLFGLIALSLIGVTSIFLNLKFLIVVLIFLILGLFLVRNEKSFYFIIRVLSRIKFIKKYLGNVSLFHNSLKKLLTFRSMSISIILSIISWGLEAFALYFLISSLGIKMSLLSIVFVYSFSSIVGALAFIPGGLGVTEGSLLSLLIFLGLPISVASLSTIIIRVATLWFGITLGLIALFVLSGRMKATGINP